MHYPQNPRADQKMKLLLENWRGYVRESLAESVNPKIMSMIDGLEKAGGTVHIGDHVIRILRDGLVIATVEFEPSPAAFGNCLGAMSVTKSDSDGSGYGPLAYDIAMEIADGLTSDRAHVSSDAHAIWDYYDKNRPDVKKDQLDNLKNFLTPEDEDNCEQLSARNDDATGDKKNWPDSVLSRKYSKSGTPVIDELGNRGMFAQAAPQPAQMKDGGFLRRLRKMFGGAK